MYLHELGDGAGSFTKDDMQAGLVLFFSFFLLTDTSFKLSAFLALVSLNVVFAIQNVLVGHVFNLKIIFEVILLDPHILPLCLGTLGLDLIRSLQKLP